jgi:hypothetical protein
MTEAPDLLLDDYLAQLGRAAQRLPAWQRGLFLTAIADRIDAELGGPAASADPDRVRAVLARIGDPVALVRGAGDVVPDWPAAQELATVLVLLIGGVIVPFVGWLVGVTLLWASPRWRLADKLLGTFVLPGGLAPAALLLWVAVRASTHLPYDGPSAPSAGLLVALTAVPPVLVAIKLLHSARRCPGPTRS